MSKTRNGWGRNLLERFWNDGNNDYICISETICYGTVCPRHMKRGLKIAMKARQYTKINRFLSLRTILWYLIGVIAFCVWFNAFYNILVRRDIWPYSSVEAGIAGVCLTSLPIVVFILVNTIVVFFIDRKIRIAPIKIITDVLVSTIGVTLANLAFMGVIMLLGKIPVVDWAELYMVDFLILLVHEVAYFVISFRLAESKANEARSHMAQLQYDVLKAQVNPHFLFNSLNLLYSLNAIDTEKAQKFILSLAKLYNYIMRQHEHQRVSLREELEQLTFYIDVLKMRYWQQFEVDIRGMENVSTQQIVPASLQMLMENVTKHNVIQSDRPMRVTVEIFPDKVIMTNPIRPKVNAHVSKSGIGLKYLKRAYGDMSENLIYTSEGEEFRVIVPLFL